LLLRCTEKPKPTEQGYLPLGKIYYKLLYPKQEIAEFIRGLWLIEKARIVLYTSLAPGVAEALLGKLELREYFPPEMRRYCFAEGADHSKHTIEIDQNTRRVIIITPPSGNRNNCEKYFLMLMPRAE
jgi:hypothetical protein